MLRPDLLLHAYSQGLFPMADPRARARIGWYAPDPRALIPLDDRFRVPRSLRRLVRQGTYTVTTNRAFEGVIRACAAPAPGRESTWISQEIEAAYTALHHLGYAHSVECWQAGALVGGLYGVALRGAFFGESMFHTARDASKVALVHLVERLRAGGFVLLDTQFLTEHLVRFGAYEVPRAIYERRLAEALGVEADWFALEGTAQVPRA
jgi:leucyl/phenylalanyl-tRNA---protein transferase